MTISARKEPARRSVTPAPRSDPGSTSGICLAEARMHPMPSYRQKIAPPYRVAVIARLSGSKVSRMNPSSCRDSPAPGCETRRRSLGRRSSSCPSKGGCCLPRRSGPHDREGHGRRDRITRLLWVYGERRSRTGCFRLLRSVTAGRSTVCAGSWEFETSSRFSIPTG